MNCELYTVEGSPANWQEAIKITSEVLYENNCVYDTFRDACISREKVFPTGLPIEVPIAIPHTDSKHAKKSSMCFLRLKEPIPFNSMQDTEQEIYVKYVLNFSVAQDKDQVKTLVAIINIFQDKDFLEKISSASLQQVKEELVSQLKNYEAD